jgi:hypothetical protein
MLYPEKSGNPGQVMCHCVIDRLHKMKKNFFISLEKIGGKKEFEMRKKRRCCKKVFWPQVSHLNLWLVAEPSAKCKNAYETNKKYYLLLFALFFSRNSLDIFV